MHRIKLHRSTTPDDWRRELASAITSVDELLKELALEHLKNKVVRDTPFRLLVPRTYAARMQRGNPDDPLLKQVLPLAVEDADCGVADPVGDLDAMVTPGLLHKYKARVLLVTTGACAVHCRYCFRRHFPYASFNAARQDWQQAFDYIRRHDDIREVILSGGDPLLLDNARLERLFIALEQIPHLEWLRIHTRVPVVLPSRIDHELACLLRDLRFRTTIVIHANHGNELVTEVSTALQRLLAGGASLLNQSVLLKGINDSAAALIALSKRLYRAGVLPYYLHMLDPVQGAMHFNVPESRAAAILKTLQAELPGYLVPRLVREIPGETSKTAIFTI